MSESYVVCYVKHTPAMYTTYTLAEFIDTRALFNNQINRHFFTVMVQLAKLQAFNFFACLF